jgi:tetratricopeptide (TPR) repeat protein
MALCRQIGIDVGILTFTPRLSQVLTPSAADNRPPIAWVTAAAIDGKLYLFEQRLGLEIASPDGKGVATLEEALTDPIVLSRLDVPGTYAYGTTGAEIAASTSGIGVLVDSSSGYFAPRMRLLQSMLKGEYRTVLYRDLLEQAKNFAGALGSRVGKINFWELPTLVETSLFNNPDFVAATQMSLQFFDGKLPLLYARTAHLRGETDEAITKYVALRLIKDGVQRDAAKTPIPPDVQRGLDVYSTYFLAQCHMDRGNIKQAEGLFRQLLDMTPDPGPGRYYFYMLRWGALSNLGRISEKKGDKAAAIKYYSQYVQPFERHGNMLKARELLWENPFLEPAAPLPPAPSVAAVEAKPSTPAVEAKPAVAGTENQPASGDSQPK